MEETPDLDFVTTDDLVRELMRRHDHIVIARESKRDDDTYRAIYDYDGSLSAAIGLTERLKAHLLRYAEAGATDEPEE